MSGNATEVAIARKASQEAPEVDEATTSQRQPLVMQLVVRRDLVDTEGWGPGALLEHVVHATAAVLHETRDLPDTQAYLEDLENMRKVILQADDRRSIMKLARLLSSSTPPVPHHLRSDQPEDGPICLALAPNRRDPIIKKALKQSGSVLWLD